MVAERFCEYIEKKMKGGFSSILVLYTIGTSEGPIHGYHIIQRINRVTEGSINFGAGTVYPILRNLERIGLVEHCSEKSERGPSRKAYNLTCDGRAAVRQFDGMVSEFFEAVKRIRSDPEPSP